MLSRRQPSTPMGWTSIDGSGPPSPPEPLAKMEGLLLLSLSQGSLLPTFDSSGVPPKPPASM